jgi:hypothetical protein
MYLGNYIMDLLIADGESHHGVTVIVLRILGVLNNNLYPKTIAERFKEGR